MMIKLLRVDHRLLHGQVAVSWVNNVNADCILIANDKVAANEMWKTTLKLAKPTNTKLVIKGMDDSIKAINSGATDKYRLLILVENVFDALELCKACKENGIQSVNLGGAKHSEGAKALGKSFYATSEEWKAIQEIIDLGIEAEVRQVPDEAQTLITKGEF